jgi:hypothetical protein
VYFLSTISYSQIYLQELPEVNKRLMEESYVPDNLNLSEEMIESKSKKLKDGEAPGRVWVCHSKGPP